MLDIKFIIENTDTVQDGLNKKGYTKDILDLDIYKKLKLQSARTDNYKAIAVEVPIDERRSQIQSLPGWYAQRIQYNSVSEPYT